MENILLDQVLQQVQNKEISIEKARELICVLFNVVKQSELLVCDNCKYTAIYEGYEISYLECIKCGKTKAY